MDVPLGGMRPVNSCVDTTKYRSKFGKFMDANQYLLQTEHATKQLFDALQFYLDQLQKSNLPIFKGNGSNEQAREEEFKQWSEQHSSEIQQASQNISNYLGYVVAKSTICGSIL